MSRTARRERRTRETEIVLGAAAGRQRPERDPHGHRVLRPHAGCPRPPRRLRSDRRLRGRSPHRRSPHGRGRRDRAGRRLRRGTRGKARGSSASPTPRCRSTRRWSAPSWTSRAALSSTSRIDVPADQPRIGDFDAALSAEFWRAFATEARITLHLDAIRGDNAHHLVEATFKAAARALRCWPPGWIRAGRGRCRPPRDHSDRDACERVRRGGAMKRVVVLDYGAGNLRSVVKAFEHDRRVRVTDQRPGRCARGGSPGAPGTGPLRAVHHPPGGVRPRRCRPAGSRRRAPLPRHLRRDAAPLRGERGGAGGARTRAPARDNPTHPHRSASPARRVERRGVHRVAAPPIPC